MKRKFLAEIRSWQKDLSRSSEGPGEGYRKQSAVRGPEGARWDVRSKTASKGQELLHNFSTKLADKE